MAENHHNRFSLQDRGWLGRPVLITCFATLLVLLGAYALFVAPLQKKVLGHEAHALAQDLDAGVKARSVALDLALHDMAMDRVLEPKVLDNVLKTVRGRFPDILSLDVIADDGTILAMVGELPVSEAGLFRISDTTRFVHAEAAAFTWGWAFSDDSAGNCFHMTRMGSGKDGRKWFTRARFAREWVGETMGRLAADSGLTAGLVPVAVESKGLATDGTGVGWSGPAGGTPTPGGQVGVSGSWWTGPKTAQARLCTPGWLVKVEKNSAFPAGILLTVSLVVLGLVVTGLHLRPLVETVRARALSALLAAASRSGHLLPPVAPGTEPSAADSFSAKAVAEPVSQDAAGDMQAQAVFLSPMLVEPELPTAGVERGSAPPADVDSGGSETKAVSWFEPEPEEESAGPLIEDQDTADHEEGLVPEYLDVEWTESPHERSRTKPESAETRALVAPGSSS